MDMEHNVKETGVLGTIPMFAEDIGDDVPEDEKMTGLEMEREGIEEDFDEESATFMENSDK